MYAIAFNSIINEYILEEHTKLYFRGHFKMDLCKRFNVALSLRWYEKTKQIKTKP